MQAAIAFFKLTIKGIQSLKSFSCGDPKRNPGTCFETLTCGLSYSNSDPIATTYEQICITSAYRRKTSVL